MEPLQTSQPRRLIRWVTGLTCLLVVLNNVWHSPNNVLSWDVNGDSRNWPQTFIWRSTAAKVWVHNKR